MNYPINHPKNYFQTNFFWFLFGVFAFVPFEIGVEGLYVSYFLIPFLLFNSCAPSRFQFSIFLCYVAFVIVSISFGLNPEFTSFVNPILIAICLISRIENQVKLESIKFGLYTSAIITSAFLIWLAYQKEINSIFILMTSREWALPEVPFFGNGLAMLFSIAMMFAYKEKKYFLLFVFFLGGLLTTSRVPMLYFACLSLVFLKSKFKANLFSVLFFSFIIVLVFFILNSYELLGMSQGQLDLLQSRFETTEDREEVYQIAAQQISNHLLFGSGSEKLYYYEHAHNSYVQSLYKYGIFAFLSWLSLLCIAFFKKTNQSIDVSFLLLFLIVSLSQIGLQNPNVIVLFVIYSCLFHSDNFATYCPQRNLNHP